MADMEHVSTMKQMTLDGRCVLIKVPGGHTIYGVGYSPTPVMEGICDNSVDEDHEESLPDDSCYQVWDNQSNRWCQLCPACMRPYWPVAQEQE